MTLREFIDQAIDDFDSARDAWRRTFPSYDERLRRLEGHMQVAFVLGRLPLYQHAFARFAMNMRAIVAAFTMSVDQAARALQPLVEASRKIEAEQRRQKRAQGL